MSTKIEKYTQQIEENDVMTSDYSQKRRNSRGEKIKSRNNRLLAVAAAGLLAVVGVSQVQYEHSKAPLRTITETVQPKDYENPSLVAGRAEQQFGVDKADFDLFAEASRLEHKYGQLYPGERLQVQVR